jgi:2-octaprenyl-6-methoxyphenol hydroxylase
MQQRNDVLVVGGGLVGASLAIALDRIGVDVGLVEATPAGALPSVFDQRNLSFAEATVNALQALGVLPLLRRPGAPIRRIHVSRRGDFGRVRLEAADYGRAEFGQVVVARDFGEALEERLDRCTRVRRYRPARFLSLAGEAGDERAIRIAAEGAGELVLAARLLVAADGTRSGVRAALAIPTAEHDYRQVLFVARVRLDRAEAGTAWERFGRDGPSALLPRADGHHGAVHAVPADEAGVVATLDEEAWRARL